MWFAVLATASAAVALFLLAWFCRAVLRLVTAWADYEQRVAAGKHHRHIVGVSSGDLLTEVRRRDLAAARRALVDGPTRELQRLR